MKKISGVSLIILALAIILGFSLQDSFAKVHGGFKDLPLDSAQIKELRQMHRAIEDKRFDLMELFAEKSVDAAQAKVLQDEIQDLLNKISTFWLDAALAHKQANPDWQPRFGGKDGKGQKHGHGGGYKPCRDGRGYPNPAGAGDASEDG